MPDLKTRIMDSLIDVKYESSIGRGTRGFMYHHLEPIADRMVEFIKEELQNARLRTAQVSEVRDYTCPECGEVRYVVEEEGTPYAQLVHENSGKAECSPVYPEDTVPLGPV